jgi:hypothetical protein
MPFLSLSLSLSPLSLLALLLQSTFTRATTTTTTFPSTAEVDLFFPLNQTYSPTPLFPIVFGLQNAPLFPSLDPSFELLLWNFTLGYGINATSYSPSVSLSATNFTRAETAFAYGFVANLSTGYYSLVWSFTSANCSDADGVFVDNGGTRSHGVQFTIQDGAPVVDIAAPLTSDECAGIEHFAFNVTGTLEVPDPGLYDGTDTCAVLNGTTALVEGNPCAVSIGAAAASSIEAQITSTACSGLSPVVSCAPSAMTTKKSDAGGRYGPGGMGMVVLGGLMAGYL